MKIVKTAVHEEMVRFMKQEATKTFTACSPEKCPKCRVQDG